MTCSPLHVNKQMETKNFVVVKLQMPQPPMHPANELLMTGLSLNYNLTPLFDSMTYYNSYQSIIFLEIVLNILLQE